MPQVEGIGDQAHPHQRTKAEERSGQRGSGLVGVDNQGGAQARDDGGATWERSRRRKGDSADQNGAQPEAGQDVSQQP